MKTKRLIHGAAASIAAALMLTGCGGTEALEESCARIAAMQDEYGRDIVPLSYHIKDSPQEAAEQAPAAYDQWSDITRKTSDEQLKTLMEDMLPIYEVHVDAAKGEGEFPTIDDRNIRWDIEAKIKGLCKSTDTQLSFLNG